MYISYQAYDYFDLKYATNVSGTWVAATVDSDSWALLGGYSSIAIDASGKVHIGYSDSSGDLKYATSISIPTVITKPAMHITKTSAKLNATVNANRLPTQDSGEQGKFIMSTGDG